MLRLRLRWLASLATVVLVAGACSGSPSATLPSARASATTVTTASPGPSGSAAPSTSPVGTLRYVALGDSIPYGGNDCRCQGFPLLFGAWIQETTGRPVETQNFAQHDNNTAARMAVEMAGRPDLLDALRAADVITLTIGHNDTPWNATDDSCDADHGPLDPNGTGTWKQETGPCLKTEVERYRKNLASILDQILVLRAAKPTVVRFTEQYNDIPGDPCCGADAISASAAIKDAFNTAACEVARARNVACIDVYHAFNGPHGTEPAGPLLAADHTHPSAAGHARIAELLGQAGLAPID